MTSPNDVQPTCGSHIGKNNGSQNLVCEKNYALPTFFTAAGAVGATLGLVVPGRLLSETTQTSMKTSTVNFRKNFIFVKCVKNIFATFKIRD